MKSIAILTGGGPAPGMNTVVASVAKTFLRDGFRVIGLHGGYSSLFTETPRMQDIDFLTADEIFNKGGSILKMSRFKPTDEDFEKRFNLNLFKDNDIKFVDFKLTDIDGRWRHLSIPSDKLSEKTMEYGIGFDGSNYGYAPVENSDMVFVPVLDSAVIDRYQKIPTLSMIGDVKIIDIPENRPFDQYPRNVAKRALDYMKETGIADKMVIGPEYEFYIFPQFFRKIFNMEIK